MLCVIKFVRMIVFIFFVIYGFYGFLRELHLRNYVFTNVGHYCDYMFDVLHYRQNGFYELLLFANCYLNNFSYDPQMSVRILTQQFDIQRIYHLRHF